MATATEPGKPPAPGLTPVALRTERRASPLGIGEPRPLLGWKLRSEDPAARGQTQTAYEILVATSRALLDSDKGDLWSTGRITSDATQNVAYSGLALQPRQDCWWKVRVWDQDGRAAWSEPAHWTMGLLDAADWQAEWIGYDKDGAETALASSEALRARLATSSWMQTTQSVSKDAPHTVWMRRVLVVPSDRTLLSAKLLLLPDQLATLSVNGRECATVARWERATPIDLRPQLTPGENVFLLRVEQRDGYAPAVLGRLELVYTDGQTATESISPSWRWTAADPGPAALAPNFDDHTWQALVAIPEHRSPWGTPETMTITLPPAPYLRKEFAVTKPIARATVYATALGLYELSLNGSRIGADHLTPGWTSYTKRVQYQTYDVTAQLSPGKNALGAILGDGWFAGNMSYTGRRQVYGGLPRLRVQLEITYSDGTRDVLGTDGSWRATTGAIRYADIFQGYAYDARLEQPGWNRAGFDDGAWQPVVTGLRSTAKSDLPPLPQLHIEASTIEPVRTTEVLAARTVTAAEPGVQVVDFGQNMVGWARLHVRGSAGQKIVVRHGEMLNANGTVYTSNLRGAAATDTYWLKGGGAEVLEPRFTFHGFRYLEIRGLSAPIAATDVQGIVVQSALDRTGDFSCSHPGLNQLFANTIWGQRGNYLETPTDCPQRDERLGWTGDTQFFVRTGAYNFDVANFISRWLVTLSTDEQGEDGSFPDVAPSFDRGARAVTAWGDAAITCAHTVWQIYGDTRVIERHFDEFARYLGWMQSRAKNGIIRVGGYGDWLNKGGGAKTEVIDTAYYAHLAGMMSEMARAIGRNIAADYYAEQQRTLTTAWQREFLLPDGRIRDSSQTGYALAFTMNLLPAPAKAAAAQQFVQEIAKFDWHLATGFIGTPRLLPALHLAGRDDVAYRILLQETYPSWLFPVKHGATTIWERWDGWTPESGFQDIGMNSFNHYAFGSVAEYLYRFVGGIETDGPGFRHILIAPQPGRGLTHAHTSFEAPTGRIVSDWALKDGRIVLQVTVPPNTTARIRVPATEPHAVTEGGAPATSRPGVREAAALADAVWFDVVSGHYEFSAPYQLPAEAGR